MHNKLGDFIRLHREQIKPQDVGLRADGRRRTPGLRREELAQLCEVSPTWLTWLEQGRPVSASAKVLSKLAEVMHLTAAERTYLFRLADKLDPMLEISNDSPSGNLDAIVKAITAPAYILNRQWDAIAWNRPAKDLFAGWLDTSKKKSAETAQANLLHFMFQEPKAHALIADWPDRAQRLVAEFRADCGKHADEEPLASLIDDLIRDSADFKKLWNSQHVVGRDGGTRRFMHPTKGALTFEQVTLNLAAGRGYKLVMLLPE
ncbi:helix-turn-helix transcriptional regulator [Herminiimonas arsenitoxidans]|uniref:helix-turn-helix transcriptional regulator n=1 Tax=Herminiimonas arsenitoxidans TaxID=1809410 RepID=UPI00097118C5|nr:helix-turn-helix transcriptional regulator [Herminiimonas arsenitoxidans]